MKTFSTIAIGLIGLLFSVTSTQAKDSPVTPETGNHLRQPALVPLDALAKALLSRAGVARGIVSMPRCGDGRLALAVAGNGGLLVHAMDAERKNIDALAARAADGGLLGRSLYVAEGSASIIPFADDYVNLLIISDATDGNLAAASLPEIVRTLFRAPARRSSVWPRVGWQAVPFEAGSVAERL